MQGDNGLKEGSNISKGFDPNRPICTVQKVRGGGGAVGPVAYERHSIHR